MPSDWVPPLGGWLLTYLLHSTILLGAAWLGARFVVRTATGRDLLWKTALLGSLVSATAQVTLLGGSRGASFELGLTRSGHVELAGEPAAAGVDAAPLPRPAGREEWTGLIAAPSLREAPLPATGARAPEGNDAPETGVPWRWTVPTARLVEAAVLGWLLLGGGLVGLYLLQRSRALRRIGPRERVEDPALTGMLEVLRRSGRVRRPVRLTSAPGLGSPVALGGDEIVLPSAALTELDREQQEGLLAHELAHLARRDPAWLTLGCLLERFLFLQPLNRVARGQMQEAAEYLCDDWAVHRTGSGFSLARCLVKVAEWVDARPATVPLAGMAERRSQLVTRVHRLLEGRAMPATPRSIWFLAGAVTLVGLTAVAAPGVSSAAGFTETSGASPADSVGEAAPVDARRAEVPGVEAPAALSKDLAMPGDTDETAGGRLTRRLQMLERRARLQASRAMAQAYSLDAPRAAIAPMPPFPPTAPMAPALAELRAYRAARGMAFAPGLPGEGRRGDTTSIAVPALITALKDADVQVRRAAAQSLMNFEDRRAVPGLIEALRDSDTEVRATAAMALGQLEDPRAAAPLAALLKDTSVEVRRAALYALHNVEGSVSTDAILAAMADGDAEVRQAALGLALSRMERDDEGNRTFDARYIAAFSRLLGDKDADVRQQAASAIGNSGSKEAPAGLLAAGRDRDADVRQAVASALGEIGDPKAVPTLKELLGDSGAEVREQAVYALAEIRDRAALEALVGALKSSDPVVRRSAAEALGHRGDDEE